MSSEHRQSSARLLESHLAAITPTRIAVLNAFRGSPKRHLNMEQLCAAMLETGDQLGISTFKNAVYELAELGLLSRVLVNDGKNRSQTFYEIADQACHRHLYCVRCRSITEVFDAAFENVLLKHFHAHGLKPANVDLAMPGICSGCTSPR